MTTITSDTASIDAVDLRTIRDSDPSVRIIDVRTPAEFEAVHIPGAYNIPLDTLGDHAHAVARIDDPIVLVCRSGARATRAHERLTAAGKRRVHLLSGGMDRWEATGGNVARGEVNRWAMDRQVRLVAGSIVLAGLAGSTVVPGVKWLAGGVGAGLTFSAVTNTCAMGTALSKLPYNRGSGVDVDGVLAALNRSVPNVAAEDENGDRR